MRASYCTWPKREARSADLVRHASSPLPFTLLKTAQVVSGQAPQQERAPGAIAGGDAGL